MTDPIAWIWGVGCTKFEYHSPLSFSELGQQAITVAMNDAGVEQRDIDAVFCGTAYGGALAGQRVIGPLGLSGRKVVNVENACSSGSTALELAVQYVRADENRTALVVGLDKLSSLGSGALPLSTEDPEVQQGMIMPVVYAMRAQRYLQESGGQISDLAAVARKARANGARNELATQQTEVTIEDILESRKVAEPLTLFMCCPKADGAAAVVVSSMPSAGHDGNRVAISGLVTRAGEYKTGFREMGRSDLTRSVAQEAYTQAGLAPKDIDVAEVHDAFAIAELMYYEALGFAEPGEGWRLMRSGKTEISGTIPINPSGGLIARGHPVGATGLAQVCEAYWQMGGIAGRRQIDSEVRNVLTHCTGGGIAGYDHGACAVTILSAA
ncbi:MAG TPA: thiolase family protein [Arthrobacter sp.]|nr:thiolase family protein [Arthrobacter sp.]